MSKEEYKLPEEICDLMARLSKEIYNNFKPKSQISAFCSMIAVYDEEFYSNNDFLKMMIVALEAVLEMENKKGDDEETIEKYIEYL